MITELNLNAFVQCEESEEFEGPAHFLHREVLPGHPPHPDPSPQTPPSLKRLKKARIVRFHITEKLVFERPKKTTENKPRNHGEGEDGGDVWQV